MNITAGNALTPRGELIVLKNELTFSEFEEITDGNLYIQYSQQREAPQQGFIEGRETRWVETPMLIFLSTERTPSESSVK